MTFIAINNTVAYRSPAETNNLKPDSNERKEEIANYGVSTQHRVETETWKRINKFPTILFSLIQHYAVYRSAVIN